MTIEEIKDKRIVTKEIVHVIPFIEEYCGGTDYKTKGAAKVQLEECRCMLKSFQKKGCLIATEVPEHPTEFLNLTRGESDKIIECLIKIIEGILYEKFHVLPPELKEC